jgi:hypothetical protein
MDIDELASQLTIKAISKISLNSYPYEAAKQAREVFDEIELRIKEYQYPISEYALRIALAILDKKEVILKDPYIAQQIADVYGKCTGAEGKK